ncbi:hypothetical protein, partial [Sulfurirhabdus autotrophica]|uniref:hypothetical protein n=1 Tax=Sulfurirhabdus autotrophica TaxID=1706046 RepID=UPI001CB99095
HFIIEDLAAGLVFDLGDRGIIPPHIGADRGAGAAGFGNQVTLQVIMVDGGLCPLGRIGSGHLAGALALGVVVVAGQQAAFAASSQLSGLVVSVGTAGAVSGNVTGRVKGHGCTEPGGHTVGRGAVGVAATAITQAVAIGIIFKGLSLGWT